MTHIRQGDRVPIFMVTKVIDMPEHKVFELIDALGLPIETWNNGYQFTSRSALRGLLVEMAGTT